MIEVVEEEIQKQDLDVVKATKRQLLELKKICDEIEQHGLPSYLVLKKLPGALGHGIFLHPEAKPIPKGRIIGTYSGKVSFCPQSRPGDSVYSFAPISDIRLSKERQKILDPKSRFHPKRLYSMDIDAEKTGNFIRFVNHSHKPNLVSYLFTIPKNPYGLSPSPIEVIYLADKTIRPGEQLLISYEGDDGTYWKHLKIEPVSITPQTYQLDSDLNIKKI
ncbi:MAG TPA: SET domain-containing protein-lysine N-methyltransferase [Chlamydiales bacterium]|nr:SET domain-containing protein-lysine N-methyltransferase [Chlamydiales bacterium]